MKEYRIAVGVDQMNDFAKEGFVFCSVVRADFVGIFKEFEVIVLMEKN